MPNPYLEGNFAPVLAERTDVGPFPARGVVPPDLDGRLVRNGPNPILPLAPDDPDGWLAGDGMLHAVSLRDGRATAYRNRWVRTRRLSHALGTPSPRGPAEPLDGPANVHVVRHAGRTLVLGESGLPLAVSDDLERARLHDFDGDLASPVGAHPRVDPETGELALFGTDVYGPPFLRYHLADREGRLMLTEEVDLPRPSLMHDFGITATRAVFFDSPALFDAALAGRAPVPYRWTPDAPSRIGVMPRSGGAVRWVPIEPCLVVHVVNCFDSGDRVVIDAVRHERALDGGPASRCEAAPQLVRWTVDPVGLRAETRQLDDAAVELPRVDERVVGRPHRFAYAVAVDASPDRVEFPALVQYDLDRERSVRYEPGAGRSVSEPIFVRAGDGRAEDEGWVLVLVHDAARQASDLVVLDGTSFAGPPVAVVELPARVPFGLHGSWMPTGT